MDINLSFYEQWIKTRPSTEFGYVIIQNGKLCGIGPTRELAYQNAYTCKEYDHYGVRLCSSYP